MHTDLTDNNDFERIRYISGYSAIIFHWLDNCNKCRALEGLHICVTNIDEATRSRISRQTAENGGTYCGELKKDSCTHLIVGLGKTAGSAKYKFAKQWGVNCVTLQVCICHPD